MADFIYLDHAATTPLDPVVLATMQPYFTELFYNPSSHYAPAEANRRTLDAAREVCATLLNVRPSEIIFTSGGSESDNLALKGVMAGWKNLGMERRHLITTPVEHHAVLYAAKNLEEQGYEVTYLPVDHTGRIDPAHVEQAIRPDTALISVMTANNEIGTLEPIAEIGKIAHHYGIPFHTDAVQAAGLLALDLAALNLDLLSLSAHKFYGPRGVGLLYLRRGTPFASQIQGGSQERHRRAGTENLPGIVGLATALRLAYRDLEENKRHVTRLRDKLIAGVAERLPRAMLTGAEPPLRLPNHASFCFREVNGEAILLGLEEYGILCSSGSACAAGSTEPSHVLTALGLDEGLARTAVRFTLGRTTTAAEIECLLSILPEVVERFVVG
ncbi:MAG: cysteine desulfurase family protein [Chloroflexota bacterium]